jgi:hypothetical protein
MCFSSGGSAPKDPEPIQKPAQSVDPQVQSARSDSVRRTKAATGARSTILTTGGGGETTLASKRKLTGSNSTTSAMLTPSGSGKTLLGS